MSQRFPRRLAFAAFVCLYAVCAPSLLAGTTSSLANFTAPIQNVINWLTGDIGRLASILVLAMFGMYLWKKQAQDKGERGFFYLLGTALVLGATNIVDALGFVGAIY